MKDYIVIEAVNDELVIEKLYVAPENRGKGNGSKMVKEAIAKAREAGLRTVGLYAEPCDDSDMSISDLIGFYEYLGFVSSGDDSQMMTYSL